MRRQGTSILILSIFLALSFTGLAESASLKYGVVNIQRVLRVSKGGRVASSSLERERKRLQVSIQKRREDLAALAKKVQELQLEIEQKSAIWRTEEKERKAFDLRSQRREFARENDNLRRLVRESERDLQDRRKIAIEKVLKEVRSIVEEIGKQEGFDVIVENATGGVLFINPKMDLTERVIKLYDQKKK